MKVHNKLCGEKIFILRLIIIKVKLSFERKFNLQVKLKNVLETY